MKRTLYYGDNLDILQNEIADESIDLCYSDPPFNSKRNYNQIYNTIDEKGERIIDQAQSDAFIDTWTWGNRAQYEFDMIVTNQGGMFTSHTVELMTGLMRALSCSSLMAYLVSMAVRLQHIHAKLKPSGSLYLHCDPTASHYLKVLLDSIFGIDTFKNEIVWHYTGGGRSKHYFSHKHDIILWYSKTKKHWIFNIDAVRIPYKKTSGYAKGGIMSAKGKHYKPNPEGTPVDDVWDIPMINPLSRERLGYPTQKPEALLERILQASSREGDTVLDAFCGCGTTIAVAERLQRQWVGIDITYQAISVILKRLSDSYGEQLQKKILVDGIPRDMKAAQALARREDDRTRKEFEKWAILTYTQNKGMISTKKGADKGIDGRVIFRANTDPKSGESVYGRAVLQVKSGKVHRKDIATLKSDMQREGADIAIFLTLKSPTPAMEEEAASGGTYFSTVMGRGYPTIQIVTIDDILKGTRINLPLGGMDIIKKATGVSPTQNEFDV